VQGREQRQRERAPRSSRSDALCSRCGRSISCAVAIGEAKSGDQPDRQPLDATARPSACATSPPPVAQHKVCSMMAQRWAVRACAALPRASCLSLPPPSSLVPRTGRNETHKRVVWELGGVRRQKAVVATTEPSRLCGIPNRGWTRCPVRRHRQRAPESGYPLPVTLLGSL
jgi:hypothetical protein